jgi:hypothetical protein
LLLKTTATLAVATAIAGCASSDASEVGSPDDERRLPDADTDAYEREARASLESGGSDLIVLPAQFTEENMPLRMLADGDPLDLWAAPQGGHVVLLSAKVKHLVTDTATLRVVIRRPDTGFIVAQESRTVAMVPVPGEPDTKQPDLRSRSQAAHVPLCPDYDPIDIVDQPVSVSVHVTGLYTDPPATGEATRRLVPSCDRTTPEDMPLCRCECQGNYFLGKCKPDASPDRAMPSDAAE